MYRLYIGKSPDDKKLLGKYAIELNTRRMVMSNAD